MKTLNKKICISWLFVLLLIGSAHAQQAKYVFYFIGDGMGLNHVHITEMYLGELEGKIGPSPLNFSEFPHTTFATTFSASSGVTDSAAAGTALSTGSKTANSIVGLLPDKQTPLTSIAVYAKEKGLKVGIATSVAIDDATPSAFYAHSASRYNAYQIGLEMLASGYDYFAGAGFHTSKKQEGQEDLLVLARKAGYTVAEGYDVYKSQPADVEKLILFPSQGDNGDHGLPYAIDRTEADLSLKQIVEAGIDILSKDAPQGFFFMVEGGKIDWAGHSNDAATAICETIDMAEAMELAIDFYRQHPEETLIVVTADHETGGMIPGNGKYELNLKVLQYQKMSQASYTKVVNNLRKQHNNKVSWEVVRASLAENFGFWDKVSLTDAQESKLRQVYEETFSNQPVELKESLYERDEPIAVAAKEVLNEIAMVSWASGAHSGSYVPVYAIGAGAEKFHGRLDITDIPKKIAEAGGYMAE
ncbi:MAG: alkaline phosphatase [Bacteroides sp.]|nr:alkaline phosphatase [Bacteroides sp.]